MLYREDWFPLRHFHNPYKSTFDRAVVVYVYAVKNDLTNWESNLGLDKPFMTNGEFLESLELNENNIPTINGTGEDPQSYFIFIYLKSCHFIHSTHYIVYVPRDSFVWFIHMPMTRNQRLFPLELFWIKWITHNDAISLQCVKLSDSLWWKAWNFCRIFYEINHSWLMVVCR